MIFFIADTHFCHQNVIEFGKRPFNSIAEMNQALIDNWNKVVQKPTDEVYLLGDFLYQGTGQQANEILEQLHGKKYLIKGNHEKYLKDKDFDPSHFEWIASDHNLKYHRRSFILYHYPILEWHKYFQNAIHLYGHVHNSNPAYFDRILGPRAINVGAELINYTPISIEQVLEKVAEREKSLGKLT